MIKRVLQGISILIAIPASYYFMYDWLQNFVFRTGISGMIFILSGIITLFIAFATISLHTLRAGRINPADAIQYE